MDRPSGRRDSGRRPPARRRLESRPPPAADDVGEAVGSVLDEHLHARGREIFAASSEASLIELVQAHRGLARRRAPGDELPDLVLHIVERRAILAARPHVRQPFGQLATARAIACRVAAGHDERALLAERLFHELNQSFSGRERGRSHFLSLINCSTIGMRRSDQHQDRLAVGGGDRRRRLGDRLDDAGGLESKSGGEIHDPSRAVAVGAQHDVDAIRNQIVVGVGKRALVRVEDWTGRSSLSRRRRGAGPAAARRP